MPRSPNPIIWTNATKAQVLGFANAFLVMLHAFGLAMPITEILATVNAGWILFIQLTYKQSPTRVPDTLLALEKREREAGLAGYGPPPTTGVGPGSAVSLVVLALLISAALAFAPEARAQEPTASIVVELDADGAGSTDFYFKVDGNEFDLEDGEEHAVDVAAGSFLIEQEPRDGWVLVEVDCGSADTQDGDVSDYDIRVNVEDGDELRCIFTNIEEEPEPTPTPEPTNTPSVTATAIPTIEPFDLCHNIAGVQESVPDGLEWRPSDWHCVAPAPEPTATQQPPNVIQPPSTGSAGLR